MDNRKSGFGKLILSYLHATISPKKMIEFIDKTALLAFLPIIIAMLIMPIGARNWFKNTDDPAALGFSTLTVQFGTEAEYAPDFLDDIDCRFGEVVDEEDESISYKLTCGSNVEEGGFIKYDENYSWQSESDRADISILSRTVFIFDPHSSIEKFAPKDEDHDLELNLWNHDDDEWNDYGWQVFIFQSRSLSIFAQADVKLVGTDLSQTSFRYDSQFSYDFTAVRGESKASVANEFYELALESNRRTYISTVGIMMGIFFATVLIALVLIVYILFVKYVRFGMFKLNYAINVVGFSVLVPAVIVFISGYFIDPVLLIYLMIGLVLVKFIFNCIVMSIEYRKIVKALEGEGA